MFLLSSIMILSAFPAASFANTNANYGKDSYIYDQYPPLFQHEPEWYAVSEGITPLAHADINLLNTNIDISSVLDQIVKIEPHRPDRSHLIHSSADILDVRLIEKGWVEIRWTADMTRNQANAATNFRLTDAYTGVGIPFTMNTNWGYYRFPHNNNATIFITNLRVTGWQNWTEEQKQDFHWHLQVTGNVTQRVSGNRVDNDIIYDVVYSSFHATIYDFHGLRVHGSENATPANVNRAARILATMMSKDQLEFGGIITDSIASFGVDFHAVGAGENVFFAPGQRSLTTFDPASVAGGFGATRSLPTATFGHNSVNVTVHEIGHTVKDLGISQLEDRYMITAYDVAFMNAMEQRMYIGFPGTTFNNMRLNSGEFFADASSIWFNSFAQNNNAPTSRQAMEVYDPLLFYALSLFYYPIDVPGASANPSTFRGTHTRIFVPEPGSGESDRTEFVFNVPGQTFTGIPGNTTGGFTMNPPGHFFKLSSHFTSHIIGSTGTGARESWWDFSHHNLNHNHAGVRWRVLPIYEDGVLTPYFHLLNAAGTNALAPMTADFVEGQQVVGGRIGMQATNVNNHSQHWELVQVKGRFSQLVNRASGLVLTTEGGDLPGDGTPILLGEYSDNPLSGAIWRVMRVKDQWIGGTASSLHNYYHAVIPTRRDVKPERIFLDPDGFIQINWPEPVPGGAESYRVTMDGVEFELDPENSWVVGNTTILKLAEEPTAQVLTGIGNLFNLRIQFTGEAIGGESGLRVNNGITYNFRQEPGLSVADTRAKFAVEALNNLPIAKEIILAPLQTIEEAVEYLNLPTSLFGLEIEWATNDINMEKDFRIMIGSIAYDVVLSAFFKGNEAPIFLHELSIINDMLVDRSTNFISIGETARNSRQWNISFEVTQRFVGGITATLPVEIIIPGANANLRGEYVFEEDPLLGLTLVFDIRNNGRNVSVFNLY